MHTDHNLSVVSCAELRALQTGLQLTIFWCVHHLAGNASFPVDSQHVFHVINMLTQHTAAAGALCLCFFAIAYVCLFLSCAAGEG